MAAVAAGLLVSAGAAPSFAADLGGNCCADLEERIAELEATTARKGNRKVSLNVAGYINESLLFWDDGQLSDVYQGTNDAARSRVRFNGDAKIDSDWSAGYLLELGVRTNRLNRTDQFHSIGFSNTSDGPIDASGVDVRHSAWWIQNKNFGRLWVGKTDQATERITEINLAATNQFLKHYGRWNGSFVLRRADNQELAIGGTGSQVFVPSTNFRTWSNILPQSGFTGEGVPGEGDRYNVVKFDTLEVAGFVLSAAWGDDDFWDTALRYAGEFGGFKLAAGIGYSDWSSNGPTNTRGCAIDPTNEKASCSQLGLSGSIMHVDTGLFFTGAYGIKWDDERQAAFGNLAVDDTDDFYSLQAGIERKFIELGKTTIYAEYEHYNTGAGISGNGETATGLPRSFTGSVNFPNPGGGTQFMSGADIDVWGFGLNQNIEKAALDLYIGWRRAEADVFTSQNGVKNGPNSTTVAIEPIDLIMSGARIQF